MYKMLACLLSAGITQHTWQRGGINDCTQYSWDSRSKLRRELCVPGREPLQAGVRAERVQQVLAHVLHAEPPLDKRRCLRPQAVRVRPLLTAVLQKGPLFAISGTASSRT